MFKFLFSFRFVLKRLYKINKLQDKLFFLERFTLWKLWNIIFAYVKAFSCSWRNNLKFIVLTQIENTIANKWKIILWNVFGLVFTSNYIINFSLSFFLFIYSSSRSFTPTFELLFKSLNLSFIYLLAVWGLFAGQKANKRYDIMQIVKTLFWISVWEVIFYTLQSNVWV